MSWSWLKRNLRNLDYTVWFCSWRSTRQHRATPPCPSICYIESLTRGARSNCRATTEQTRHQCQQKWHSLGQYRKSCSAGVCKVALIVPPVWDLANDYWEENQLSHQLMWFVELRLTLVPRIASFSYFLMNVQWAWRVATFMINYVPKAKLI